MTSGRQGDLDAREARHAHCTECLGNASPSLALCGATSVSVLGIYVEDGALRELITAAEKLRKVAT